MQIGRIVIVTTKVLLTLVVCFLGFGLSVGMLEAGALEGFMALVIAVLLGIMIRHIWLLRQAIESATVRVETQFRSISTNITR
jgi:uncharacterized membrane protein YadS